MNGLRNKRILIISPEPYGKVFLSKQHYANELSKTNKVWFLNARGERIKGKLIRVNKINDNLSIINYYNLFFGFGKIPFFITSLINNFLSKKIIKVIGQIDIVWSFEQTKFFNLKLFQAKHSIFHPVDYIPYFNFYKHKIVDSSDIIFSVSQEILDTIQTSKPKHVINHGVSQFNTTSSDKTKFPINKNKINIAYIGNINIPYIDIKNLKKAIELNPNCDFHFIGPTHGSNLGTAKNTTNYDQLELFQNVYFQGVINQEKLVSTAKDFDILISCYDHKKYPIRLSNSHKILEYMSTGKVIISNFFPIYSEMEKELLIMLDNNENLGSKIIDISKNVDFYNKLSNQEERIKFAKENSYKNQIIRIEKLLNTI